MTRGRNTTRISIRLKDKSIELLKERASQRGLGYTVLARQLILRGLGLKQE